MEPLFFTPRLVPKLWGGTYIRRLKGLDDAPRDVGESWEISGLADAETPVSRGRDAGLTLRELTAKYGAALLGKHNLERYGTQFPLLFKFIAAREDLSLQVHPDDAAAQALGHPYGKAEMWYVLHARRGARLAAGFRPGTTAAENAAALTDGTLPDRVLWHAAHAGDCYYIPPGRIHALGAGMCVVEIQQASDDTYRICDYDRRDANGRPRALHLDAARRVLRFDDTEAQPRNYQHLRNTPATLVDIAPFTTRLLRADVPLSLDYSHVDSFVVLMAFEGHADVTDSDGNLFTLRAGQTVLLPAATRGIDLRPTRKFSCIETRIR